MEEILKERQEQQEMIYKISAVLASKKAQDAANRLTRGESTINQIRCEYGLKPVNDEPADNFFTRV